MPYNNLALEVYKFAASYLNKGFEGLLKEPELEILNTTIKVGVARKVASFLKSTNGMNDTHAARLGSTLHTLADRVEFYTREGIQGHIDTDLQFAQRLVNHGELQKGIPFVNAVIHFYAGLRLESFIDERIADESADKWYEFCKTLKERIVSFLGIFIADYERSLGKDLSAQRQAMQSGEVRKVQVPSDICDICRTIYLEGIPQFSELFVKLDAAIVRIEQYLK